ncbi:MAG: MBOAT family protein, partial [Kiritimatiellae bacterium]|nr:MBOAT family protein [Kiritimatiellia bacterium]MDW8458724.1 MBOAT family O-acyltransferase [Verrucomicrobiota bacterium]
MLFHRPTFWIFFAAFCAAYYIGRRSIRLRNAIVLAGSYVFYAGWDWRFLGLIVFSTALDYMAGLGIGRAKSPRARRAWLWASLVGNLGVLGFFKYWNFFRDNAAALLEAIGLPAAPFTLDVILPVGISFYTFQTLSYTLDVYAGRIEPTRDLLAFAAYVAFFPQLVAGPIERARSLLPQFLTVRTIRADTLLRGADLIVWGLFKKTVIADSLAPFVDAAFALERAPLALTAAATIAFGFQIYADFSGYSDIARGLARALGFELTVNFDRPYTAATLREFWRRWHISLSTWLRDYLYIPLGGSRGSAARTLRNLMTTMLLGGLWHGAAWHFVLWGGWHGLGLVLERRFPRLAGRALTLGWVFAGWFLFRVP